MLAKPVRHHSPDHLKFIRTLKCVACPAPAPSTAHHLTIAQPKARGLKAGDQWTLPMCDDCHKKLHARGDERAFWDALHLDAVSMAEKHWQVSPAFVADEDAEKPRRKPQRRVGWRRG